MIYVYDLVNENLSLPQDINLVTKQSPTFCLSTIKRNKPKLTQRSLK